MSAAFLVLPFAGSFLQIHLLDDQVWGTVACQMDWGGLNLFARAIAGCSFAKAAIVLSRAGVRFVDFVVGHECLAHDDVGEFGRGLPPCRLRLLLFLRKGRGHVVAQAVARTSCVLSMRLLVLVLDIRLTMGE